MRSSWNVCLRPDPPSNRLQKPGAKTTNRNRFTDVPGTRRAGPAPRAASVELGQIELGHQL